MANTLVYHQDGELQVRLDYYLPNKLVETLPVVIYFHPGGLCVGSRRDVLWPAWLEAACQAHSWLLVSADYPLLVPSTIREISETLDVLLDYLAAPSGLARHLPAQVVIDTSRTVVAGLSAGGYLSRLLALKRHPRITIRAMLSVFGKGVLLTDHYLVPHDKGLPMHGYIKRPVDSVRHLVEDPSKAPIATESAMSFTPGIGFTDAMQRADLYFWSTAEGVYLDLLFGQKGLSAKLAASPDRIAAIPDDLRQYLPELTPEKLPPTFFAHGDADTQVPISESQVTFRALQTAGVDSELVVVPGADHGLVIGGKPAPGLEAVFERAIAFVAKHVQ